jgi:hypothetical protein
MLIEEHHVLHDDQRAGVCRCYCGECSLKVIRRCCFHDPKLYTQRLRCRLSLFKQQRGDRARRVR